MEKKRIQNKHLCMQIICLFFLIAWFLPKGLLLADQGHNSGKEEPGQKDKKVETFSVSGSGEQFELVITYPRFKAGKTVSLTMYFADLVNNKPVSNAKILLTLTGPDTEEKLTPVFTGSPGEYAVKAKINKNAKYSFFAELAAGDDMDLFDIEGFSIPAPPASVANAPSQDSAHSFWEKNMLFIALGGMVIAGCFGIWLGSRERKTILEKHSTKKNIISSNKMAK